MPADLTIFKVDAPDPVPAGGTLVYTLEVTNDGPGQASDIEVKDTLPPGVTYINDDCSGTVALPTVTCALFDLAPTDNKIITIEVQVDADLVDTTGSASLSNEAEVTSLTTPDPDTNNNSAIELTEVRPGCAGVLATISGTPGNDQIDATMGNDDVIATLAGNDNINGRDGNDKICGGPGHDNILAGSGNDVIEGGPGNDNITGGPGIDTIDGGPGNDNCAGENVTACNP